MPSQPRYHLINEKGTNALLNPLKIYGCLIGTYSTLNPSKSFIACLVLHEMQSYVHFDWEEKLAMCCISSFSLV